ncbi:MAG: hypothetical protein GY757_32235 [bacterium]|nr:hypothetical protein [bacterium]
MIQKINIFFTRVFDVVLYPFGFIPPFWGILFLSIVMAFVVLYIYKYLSSPSAVKDTKDQIKAHILAIRLYRDFWKIIVSSFFKSLFYTFKYFILNFGPVLLIIPILFPAFMQMDIRYGMEPFKVGDEIVIKAAFSQNPNEMEIELMENEYYKTKMPPVFINAYREYTKDGKREGGPVQEVNWKVEALKEGNVALQVKIGGKVFEKSLVIGDFSGALSNKKYSSSQAGHFIYPAEPLADAQGLEYFYIQYPGKEITFAGITTHWILFNLILVLIVVLAFKNKFGIEF